MHARILADDVPRPPPQRLWQFLAVARQVLGSDVAELRDLARGILSDDSLTQERWGPTAFAHPLIVAGAGERMGHAGLKDGQRIAGEQDGDMRVAELAAIQQQRMMEARQARSSLTEHTDFHADALAFGALAELRHIQRVERGATERRNKGGRGDFPCGGGTEAAAHRHIAIDDGVEDWHRWRAGERGHLCQHAAYIAREERQRWRGSRTEQRQPVRWKTRHLAVMPGCDMHLPVFDAPACQRHDAIDRHRQDEAAGIVGMLANQIDAPWRPGHSDWLPRARPTQPHTVGFQRGAGGRW